MSDRTRLVERYSIALFFLISCSISWGGWLFNPWLMDMYRSLLQGDTPVLFIGGIPFAYRLLFVILGLTRQFGPAIAACVVTTLIDGRRGLGKLLRGLVNWQAGRGLYCIVLLIPLAIQLVSPVGVALGFGGALPNLTSFGFAVWCGMFLSYMLYAGGQEELGFRGFAQVRLEGRFGPYGTSLIVGVLWFLWHLPLYLWVPGGPQYGSSLLFGLSQQVAVTFIFTWVYSRTRSVLMVMLLHASFNFCGWLLTVQTQTATAAYWTMTTRVLVCLVVGLVLIRWFPTTGRTRRATASGTEPVVS